MMSLSSGPRFRGSTSHQRPCYRRSLINGGKRSRVGQLGRTAPEDAPAILVVHELDQDLLGIQEPSIRYR